ncbi:hypothetical protein KIW84_012992 [Lathyrus oleraceus]|uniref:DUF7745 domain-containing protein n=1 Tax=Pisum sativum TaxID=3888 RepID=A0A9D5BJ62_PEA|nr:hypothetical protein KIW84_012992 [Pisum sativum]
MESGKEKTLQFKIREPKTDNLGNYAMSLSKGSKNSLNYKFGKILYLLSVPVHMEALTNLTQFFDPSLRFFQFQYFQLAPTLEEFSKILEIYKPAKGPFKMIRYRHTLEEMAFHLCIHEADLQANLRWDAMDNIMILLTFGLILVPTENYFVDYTTINLFLDVKVGDENHVPALLADVYHTLYQGHTNMRGLILQEINRNHATIQRIIHAWGQLNKGILKRPREEPIVPYAQWMREREHITKLLFVQEGPVAPKAPSPIMISVEEGNNLNTTILQLKKEKIIAQDNLTLQAPYQNWGCQKKTIEKIEQNQVALRKDIESLKGNVEGMKDKIDQLTRDITNMMAIEVEADKRKVTSTSTPPPMDVNPIRGFIYDIQGGETNIPSQKNNTLYPEGFIPIFIHNGASRPVQIPVPQNNYMDLSLQYEDEDHKGIVQESKPVAHPANIIGEIRVGDKYKILEERLKLHGDYKICRSNPDKCEKMKRCLQQMMNQGFVQIGYSKKIEDVSAIESQGHLSFEIPYQRGEVHASFQIHVPMYSHTPI